MNVLAFTSLIFGKMESSTGKILEFVACGLLTREFYIRTKVFSKNSAVNEA